MSVSKKLRRYRGWIAATALVAVAGIAWFMFQGSGVVEPTLTYQTGIASLGTISVTVSGTGNLEIDGTTEVYPDANGTVDEVKIAEGDMVATGTVLFTLDASDAQANTAKALASYRQSQQSVAQANSSLAKAENSLAELEETFEEQQSADEVDSSAEPPAETSSDESSTQQVTEVTQDDIDTAELEVAASQASLNSANASLASASLSYDQAVVAQNDLSVSAPCSGLVYSLSVEPGDSVSSGSSSAGTAGATSSSSDAPIVLAPEQPLSVHLTVNEVDVPTLAVGQRADIEFDALPELTATGKIYEISDEGANTQGVVTFDVWLSVDVADAALRSGMSAAATIVTDVEGDALLVPNASINSDGDGGYYIEVLRTVANTDETQQEPEQVSVTIGLSNATNTQILSGLSEGDVVVTQTVESTDDEEESSGGGFMMPGMGGGRPQ